MYNLIDNISVKLVGKIHYLELFVCKYSSNYIYLAKVSSNQKEDIWKKYINVMIKWESQVGR